jgi:ketosteroid isomerase-like protein
VAATLGDSRLLAATDWHAYAASLAPGFVLRDHRVLGFGTLDAENFVRMQESLRNLSPDARDRREHIRISEWGVLNAITRVGTREGGAFEIPMITVVEVDEHGRRKTTDLYDIEDRDRALARFAELAAPAPAESPFANAATRYNERFVRAWDARDWNAVREMHRAECHTDDRRRLMRIEGPTEDNLRFFFDQPHSCRTATPIATRGERLALSRVLLECDVEEWGGAAAIDYLCVDEVDADGLSAAIVLFDPDDLDAAYAELDARFDAGEGAAHAHTLAAWRRWERAIATRDWNALGARRSPGFVFRDHRLLGWGTTMSDGASAVQITKALVDLAPDVQRRHDHVRLCERGILEHLTWVGTRDGGAFENVTLAVYEWDAQGRLQATDNYDVERFDLARARFAELAAPAAAESRFANAATRYNERFVHAWDARDWNAVREMHRPECQADDRRRLVRIEGPAEDGLRFFFDQPRSRWTVTPIATRGERLALSRLLLECDVDEEGGAAAIDYLCVDEVDADGLSAAMVVFDPDDLGAAYDELDARYDVLEAALHPRATAARIAQRRPYQDRDWDAFAATHAPDLVCHDHRLLGWGTLLGVEAWMRTQQVLVELAPDTGVRNDHVITSEHGYLRSTRILGTRDGGAFELAFLRVDEIDAAGKVCRIDLYDADKVDAALARFAELDAKTPRDSLAALATPNLVTAAWERLLAAYPADAAACDWEGSIRQLCAPDMRFEDRQRLSQIFGDRELFLASLRERVAMGARSSNRLVGTAGDRVAVTRVLWSGGPADGRFEIEFLCVAEVDASGLFTAIIMFDPDVTREAQREAWRRWFAIDPAARAVAEPIGALMDAFNEHDAAKFRALLADDLVVEDHRLAGLGRIDGADAYGASIVALWELAPDTRGEMGLLWPAFDRHGAVTVLRRGGVLPDGGEFESVYLYLLLVARGRIHHAEMFELGALATALARFEALRGQADPS